MRYIIFLIILITTTVVSAQHTVETVPNQKLLNGSNVSNPDHILNESTVAQIDTILTSLEKNTSVQVAVVVLGSIGTSDPFDFSQQLFTTWGIGRKENNNGLLILFVNDIRTVRFHTGDGIEGVLPDVVCKRIQRDYMVPAFKNGDYQTGMLAGIQQVEKILMNPTYAEELRKPENETSDWVGFVTFLAIFILPILIIVYAIKAVNGKFADSKKKNETPYPEMRLGRWTWIIEFAAVPLLIVILFSLSSSDPASCFLSLYLYYMLTLFHRLYRTKKVIKRFLSSQDYSGIVEFLRNQQWYWLFISLAFPVPFLAYFFYHLYRKRKYRNHPRNCKECNGRMTKLNETEEDQFLTPGQQVEEKIKSVDYDVWQCTACASVEFWFYLNRFSKYNVCPKCKTIAAYEASNRTIQSATYTSSGTGEKIIACKFCSYSKKSTYSIAKLVQSTSSGSSGYSGGSSSSGGGSWGGGSSSGGGASSSW
jgi:uncharacterized protein